MTWSSPVGSAVFFGAAPLVYLVLVALPDAIRRTPLKLVGIAATLFLVYAFLQAPNPQLIDLDVGYRAAFAGTVFSAVFAAALFDLAAARWSLTGLRRGLVALAFFALGTALAVTLYSLWANSV